MVTQVLFQVRLKVNARRGQAAVDAEAVEILACKSLPLYVDVLGRSHGCEEFLEPVSESVLDQTSMCFCIDQDRAWKRVNSGLPFEDGAVDAVVGQSNRKGDSDRSSTDDEYRVRRLRTTVY